MTENIIHLVVGPIVTNCWIYKFNSGEAEYAAVIDPGDEAEKIIAALKENSLIPKYILLTHGHFDHIGAVAQLKKTFADGIQIAIHREDAKYIGLDAFNIQKQSLKAAMGDDSLLNSLWHETPPEDIVLEEGSEIGPFTVLHTPGHSRGSVCFWDKSAGVLFSGDTLFLRGYGRTDLPDSNGEQLFQSLGRLLSMDGNIAVYPGHGRATSIGREKEY